MRSAPMRCGASRGARRSSLTAFLPFTLLVAVILTPVVLAAQNAVVASPRADTSEWRGTAGALRPGDVIKLDVWREPDLTGEFAIDEDGAVVLPKIGRIQAVGETPRALREQIFQAYAASLNHTSITVRLLRRVQVLGAVRQPGVYPVDATMTIGDVLAVAGGTTSEGNPKRLELIRNGNRILVGLDQRSRISDSPVMSGDQLFVPERPWLRRNSHYFIGAGVTIAVSLLLSAAR